MTPTAPAELSTTPGTTSDAPRPRVSPQQAILAALLAGEVLVFALFGKNFFTSDNFFGVTRLSVDLGLLALAMTPVIVTGGIDLSAGTLLGLCAVLFGKLWRDAGLPPGAAAAGAVGFGALGGWLNAALITRLRVPPLIATLGTFALFGGVAEGLTQGADNLTNFPKGFLFLGQGYIGPVPAQAPIFLLAAVGFYVLLHRSIAGRALSAIGYSPEGARHAGIPVEKRVALVYVLSGLAAGVAGVVYAARLGQAKANAGVGYELAAITAVVLGGTSIFGGRGTVPGTLLGLFAIAVLQNGLRLAAWPSDLGGILTGFLLLLSTALERLSRRRSGAGASASLLAHSPSGAAAPAGGTDEELNMKNSQLAVLCAVILAAALIVTGGNFALVKSIQNESAGRAALPAGGGTNPAAGPAAPRRGKPFTIAMMPKSKGNSYFIACRKGAEDAAKELNVELLWDGPNDPDPAKQNEIVDTWIIRGVDVIAAAVENREGLSTVLRKAREKGIKVITWDADAEPDARDFFVNQATPQGIGTTLMDNAARVMGGKGEFAIITASLTAANMNEWQKYIELRRKEKYPDIKMAALRPCDDVQSKAFEEANTILNANPNVKLIMAICSPAVPGAAEAVKQSGRKDVKVIGLGLPSENKKYVHDGVTDDIVLWNTMDLGYLAVQASYAIKAGTLKPGDAGIQAGRVGKVEIQGDNILLGKPFTFTKENIDQFDF